MEEKKTAPRDRSEIPVTKMIPKNGRIFCKPMPSRLMALQDKGVSMSAGTIIQPADELDRLIVVAIADHGIEEGFKIKVGDCVQPISNPHTVSEHIAFPKIQDMETYEYFVVLHYHEVFSIVEWEDVKW